MILGFGNNITSKLASDITSLQTNIPIDPGSGEIFAKLLTTDMTNTDVDHKIIAKITLSNLQQTVWEICHLTAVDGDNLTVIRGQEGTANRGWKLGDLVGNFATRGSENNFVQSEQLQGGDYVYSAALGTGNNLVINLPSTYTKDNWDLKTPIVIIPNSNNTGNVTIQLILGGMNLGTFPVYKANKIQLVRNDIVAGIPFVVILGKTKTFFYIINGNYLSLTGGEVNGALTINGPIASRSDKNSDISLEKRTSDNAGYTIRRYLDDMFIYASKNGVVNDNYITKYDKSTDTWDFNTAGLTKNGVPITSGNDFKYEFTPDSSAANHGNGVIYLPNGLMIQFIYSKAKSKTYKWPMPFTEFVTAVNAGGYSSDADTWNISIYYGLEQVQVGQPSIWNEATFIAIGK